MTGTNLTTGNVAVAAISATTSVSIDLGGMSGSAVITAIDTDGSFTFNAGSAANLAVDIETLSASAATITLGAVSESSHANGVSAVNVDTFTLNGTNYREIFTSDTISASGVSMTFGDLADAVSVSAIVTETFTFNGGDGANFSATITNLDINASDFSITMAELGNGLTIATMTHSGSGTISGTNSVDNISASSTSAAGDTVKFEFNMGEDSSNDVLQYAHGAGKELVKITQFDTTSDSVSANVTTGTSATAIGVATAASMIGGALGLTISSSDVASGAATALFTYNGDTFFLSQADSNALDGTFDDGEVVFQFVGVTDIVAGDIGAI